jgi:DNA-binding NarL/FixJ family response regulator
MPIKIAIVDDNSFLINAVKEKLSFFEDLNFKFSAMNGSELLVKLEDNHNLDLILMDIEMPVLNGIETTEIVKQKFPHIKIIMLTVFDNDENIFNAIKAGADGYLLKEINAKDLHDGIIETLNGGAAMNPSIALKTLKLLRNPITIQNQQDQEEIQLTTRETEVLEQLSKGLNYVKIAENLILSTGTVRKHIENIYKKLQVHNKLEAVQKAKKNNLI